MRSRTRSLVPAVLLAVLMIAAAGFVARGIWVDGALDAGAPDALVHEAPAEAVLDAPGASPSTAEPDAAPTPPGPERTPLPQAPAPRETFTRVRAMVVDAATQETLPAFLVGVSTAALQREATTDARGEIAVDVGPSEGEHVGLALVDHRGLGPHHDVPTYKLARAVFGAMPIPVAVDVGPTLFLELELPAGYAATDLEARLTRDRPFARTSNPSDALLRAPVRAAHPATLHPTLPWVRFGRPAKWERTSWVELRTLDGRWRGGAWIDDVRGTREEPLAIELELGAFLVARAETADGAPVRHALLDLTERVPAGSSRAPRKHRTGVDDGALRIDFIEPGDYVLRTFDREWHLLERKLAIVPGENDLGTLVLEPRHVVGDVRGTIESASGNYDGVCHVSLSHVPFDHDALYNDSVDFDDEPTGRFVAAFEFRNVTAGTWYLYVHCHDGFEHPGSLLEVTAPRDDVRIVLEDRSLAVTIDLVDARTSAPVADGRVAWTCGDVDDEAEGAHVELSLLPDAPERLELLAWSPRHRAMRGTDALRDYVPSGAVTPGRLHLRFALETGFSALVVARERSSGGRLAGARVFFDGALAGLTDARGELWYASDARPEHLRVELEGWRWMPTRDVDPESGRFGLAGGPRLDVALERER